MSNKLILERWMKLAGLEPIQGQRVLSEVAVPEANVAEYLALMGVQQWIKKDKLIHPVAISHNAGNFVTYDGNVSFNLNPMVTRDQSASQKGRMNISAENEGDKSYGASNSTFIDNMQNVMDRVEEACRAHFKPKWPGEKWKVVNLFLHPDGSGHSDIVMAIQPYASGENQADVYQGLYGKDSPNRPMDPKGYGLEVFQFHVKTSQQSDSAGGNYTRFAALSASAFTALDAALGTNIQQDLVNMFRTTAADELKKFSRANGLRYSENEDGHVGIQILDAFRSSDRAKPDAADNVPLEAMMDQFEQAKEQLKDYLDRRFTGRQWMMNIEFNPSQVQSSLRNPAGGWKGYCKFTPIGSPQQIAPGALADWGIEFDTSKSSQPKEAADEIRSVFVGMRSEITLPGKSTARIVIENHFRNRYSITSMLLNELSLVNLRKEIKKLGGSGYSRLGRSELEAMLARLQGSSGSSGTSGGNKKKKKKAKKKTWATMTPEKKAQNVTSWCTAIAQSAGLEADVDLKHVKDWSDSDGEDVRYHNDDRFTDFDSILDFWKGSSQDPSKDADAIIIPSTFLLVDLPQGNAPNKQNFRGYTIGEEYVPEPEIAQAAGGMQNLYWKKGPNVKSQLGHSFAHMENVGGLQFSVYVHPSGGTKSEFMKLAFQKRKDSAGVNKVRGVDFGNVVLDPTRDMVSTLDQSDTEYTTADDYPRTSNDNVAASLKKGKYSFVGPYANDYRENPRRRATTATVPDSAVSSRTNVGVDDSQLDAYYDQELEGSYQTFDSGRSPGSGLRDRRFTGTPDIPAPGTKDDKLKSRQKLKTIPDDDDDIDSSSMTPRELAGYNIDPAEDREGYNKLVRKYEDMSKADFRKEYLKQSLVGKERAMHDQFANLMMSKNPTGTISLRQMFNQGRLSKEKAKDLGLMDHRRRRGRRLSEAMSADQEKKRNRLLKRRYRNYNDALAPNSKAKTDGGKYKLTLKDLLDSGVLDPETKEIPKDFKLKTFTDKMKGYDTNEDGVISPAEWEAGNNPPSADDLERQRLSSSATDAELDAVDNSVRSFQGNWKQNPAIDLDKQFTWQEIVDIMRGTDFTVGDREQENRERGWKDSASRSKSDVGITEESFRRKYSITSKLLGK